MKEHRAAAEIGQRIRALRSERGLSLSELALRAGVGKATLSGLEAGTRNPTVETLYAITAQLDVPLTAVLGHPAVGVEPAEVIHGAAVSGTLLESFVDGPITTEVYRLRIRPGAVQLSPAHPRGVTEHLTVFVGTVRVGPVDNPFVVPAGSHARWASDVPHIYAAEGDVVAEASLVMRYDASPAPTTSR